MRGPGANGSIGASSGFDIGTNRSPGGSEIDGNANGSPLKITS